LYLAGRHSYIAGCPGPGTVTTPNTDEVVRAAGSVPFVSAVGAAAALPVSYLLRVGFAAVFDH
jgi:hypothetical protein